MRRSIYCQTPDAKPRKSTRGWKPEKVLNAVREYILKVVQKGQSTITAEEVVRSLRLKKSAVTAAFQKLANEGIVGHKHRSRRMLYENDWFPSVFTLLIGKEKGERIE